MQRISKVHGRLVSQASRIWEGLLVVEQDAFVVRGRINSFDNRSSHELRLGVSEAHFLDRNGVRWGVGQCTFRAHQVEFQDLYLRLASKEDGRARIYYRDVVERVHPNLVEKIGKVHLRAA